MPFVEKIQTDLKDAMRAGQVLRRETLRMVLAELKNRRIEVGHELDDAEAEAVLRRCVKTRQESAEQYAAGGRPELAAKEREEIELIAAYLPQQISDEDVRRAAREVIAETGASSKKDAGAVMKALMAKHKGRIDGRAASRIVAELLE